MTGKGMLDTENTVDLLQTKEGKQHMEDFEKINGIPEKVAYLFAIEKDNDGEKGIEFTGSTNPLMMIGLIDYAMKLYPKECGMYIAMRMLGELKEVSEKMKVAIADPANTKPI